MMLRQLSARSSECISSTSRAHGERNGSCIFTGYTWPKKNVELLCEDDACSLGSL